MLLITEEESTFKNYDKTQAQSYARHRQDYSQALYDAVLLFHARSGGGNNLLLDVGCGPGNVTRALCTQFNHAVGLDASHSMALHAEELSRETKARTRRGEPPRFHHATAEALGTDLHGERVVADGSVDLITVANAAHCFDMPAFWRAAHRVLRPRGTVAIWIPGEGLIHPATPGAQALDALVSRFIDEVLVPHYAPGNFPFRDRYRNLPLPWTSSPPVHGFVKHEFQRREWNIGHDKEFLSGGGQPVTMERFVACASTLNPMIRWREANPDIAHTDKDVLNILRRKMEEVLHKQGVKEGEEKVRMTIDGTLLMVKKR
ncbi:hypothetical protein PWT90_09730 [Aphanocladium album]|nr:hypothetical protein PWT90_09730 [Aphanocladium album]